MADSLESNANSHQSSHQNFNVPVLSQIPPISVKLTDENFLMWQQQVEATVWGYGLESFLTGEVEPPPQTVPGTSAGQTVMNPEYVAWRRQDQRLVAWLLSSLSESAMVLVVGLKTTKDIWSALLKNFVSRSKARAMQYKLMIQTMKKESLPMKDYLSKMKSCFDLLGSAGNPLSEEDQILHILTGLGHEYDPVVVSISTRVDPWTVQDVTSTLLSFESRLSSGANIAGSMEESQPSLNLAQQSGQRRDNFLQQGRGGNNNTARGGRSYRGRGGRGHSTGKIICQLCEKPGHSAIKCWYRFEQGFNSQNQRGSAPQQPPYISNPAAHLVHVRPQSVGATQSVVCPSKLSYDGSNTTSWYLDSGATNHVSHDLSNLNICAEYSGGKRLLLGDGFGMNISHIGETYLNSNSSSSNRKLLLKNLLHVPHITKNLLSVSQFASDNKVFFEFHPSFCLVKDQASKEVVLQGILDNGLYRFLVKKPSIKRDRVSTSASNQDKCVPTVLTTSLNSASAVFSSPSNVSSNFSVALWHKRLGHPAIDIVKSALNSCNIPFSAMNSSSLCNSCCISKAHRLPYSLSQSVCNEPLELIHSDLWGPSPTTSRNGYVYYVSFIDQYSRFTWVYLLKYKSDVCVVFKQFKALVENLYSKKIKMLQSDWGGESFKL